MASPVVLVQGYSGVGQETMGEDNFLGKLG